MNIILTFDLVSKPQVLPFNYKYPLSAWIYKQFSKSDKDFADILHQYGYKTNYGKTFKFFTFSDLIIPNGSWKILKGTDRMQIWANQISLKVSFQLPEQIQHFVVGIFRDQQVEIGDKISKIKLKVASVELAKPATLSATGALLRSLSPIVIGITNEQKKHETYISPKDTDYEKLFFKNLADKYTALKEYTKLNHIEIHSGDYALKLKTENPRSVLQTIKAFTQEETKVKGFKYDFELQAPKELIEIGLNCGFGSMNALGFGYCEIITD